jgi:acyl carrier protein
MEKSVFLTRLQEELEFDSELEINTNIKDLDDWDSMAAMVLIGFVSDEFGMTLNADDIAAITTIESLIEKIGQDKFN